MWNPHIGRVLAFNGSFISNTLGDLEVFRFYNLSVGVEYITTGLALAQESTTAVLSDYNDVLEALSGGGDTESAQ